MIMRYIFLLFSLLFYSYNTVDRSYYRIFRPITATQQETKDWSKISTDNYSYLLPNEFKEHNITGIDSFVQAWQNNDISIYTEYSPYAISTEFRNLEFISLHRIIMDGTKEKYSTAYNIIQSFNIIY